MTSILRGLAILTLLGMGLGALPATADEPTVKAAPAVYAKSAHAQVGHLTGYPGYYYYGVYYGSYRWRYQPYYTFYASPWYGYGSYYTPYAYAWPGYGYTAYSPYTFTWPHYGAYGYTYYGPGLVGY